MKKFISLFLLLGVVLCAKAQIVDAELATKPGDQTVFYQTPDIEKKNTFIVVSKTDLRVYVYGTVGNDTVLMAKFPACLSRNKGQKERRGDNKTPECSQSKPFHIQAIRNSSSWTHNFNDGRGSIKAYGAWFLSINTPGFSGIGIHGSTNNENSVPGRESEGCIRLRDTDIILLKERFAYINMPVIIKDETQEAWPWELKAHKNAKKKAIEETPKKPVDKEANKQGTEKQNKPKDTEKQNKPKNSEKPNKPKNTEKKEKGTDKNKQDKDSNKIYIVKEGDTLTKIAKKHSVTKDAIMKENNIKDENVIKIGQKLKIPNSK